MLQLTNTLSARKEPFTPSDPAAVKVYVCGPTVYDFAHVGHVRCYVTYDVLIRHLRARGLVVQYVRNITDVDDKIVQRAKQNGETPTALAARFATHFAEDMARLGNLVPDVEPRVSDHLPEIVSFVEDLIAKGHAYAVEGDVYFHVPSFPNYGRLSNRPIEALVEGASGRIGEDEAKRKRHPADFALWKSQPASEWGWASPWGHGRPGWHIECSAMSCKHCGPTLDLHGGGLDLVFPHHENEIAQSEARNGATLATLWMHNGFVEIDKEKMSKSLGNFFTARDIFERHEPESLRFAMMTVHYRSPLNFEVSLDEAGHVIGFPLFEDAERRVEYLYDTRLRLASIDPGRVTETGAIPEAIAAFPKALASALDDDLNMPRALAALSDFLKATNELVDASRRKKGTAPRSAIDAARHGFTLLASELALGSADARSFLLAIRARRAAKAGIDPAWVEARLEARAAARDARDFATADAVRDELVGRGIELMDGAVVDGRATTDWRIPG